VHFLRENGRYLEPNGAGAPRARVFFHVAALENPVATQRGQTLLGSAGKRGIAPRPGAIIDVHRIIRRDRAGVRLRRRHFDLTHRHTDVGMNCAGHENLFGGGQLFAAVRLK